MNISLFPLLPLTAAFVTGLLLYGAGLGWQGVAISVPVAMWLCLRGRRSWGVSLLGLAAGVVTGYADRPYMPEGLPDGAARRYSAGVLDRRETDGAQSLVVRIDSVDGIGCRSFSAALMIPGVLPDTDDTDYIAFSARLAPLTDRRDLPDEVDYTASLRLRGVVASAIVAPDSILSVTPRGGFAASVRRARHEVRRLLAFSPLDPAAGQFLTAALTGDREILDPGSSEIFSTAGIAHILALSGLHVAIIAGVLNLLLIPLVIAGHRKIRMAAVIVALWLFAVMTGLTPSVVRAAVMSTVMLTTMMIERERAPLNALCIAALAILVVTPSAVYSFGFQLSFLAVASILLFMPLLTSHRPRHPFARTLLDLAAVSLTATIGSGMLAAYRFGFFPLWFIPVNVIVSFILPPLLGCGVVLVCCEAIGVPTAMLASVIDGLYSVVASTADHFASLPLATVDTSRMPATLLWFYFAVLMLLAVGTVTRRRVWLYAAVPTALCGVLIVTLSPSESFPQAEMFVTRSSTETTLIVRQGTRMQAFSTLRAPGLPTLRERCHRLYAPYMSRRGVDSIEFVSVTSPAVFTLGGHSVMLAARHATLPDSVRGPEYLVVCRGFRGDIVRLARAVRPDTVALSADLNRRLHDRWLRELADSAIPAISLRPRPLTLK